jgi:hypothetical protein
MIETVHYNVLPAAGQERLRAVARVCLQTRMSET